MKISLNSAQYFSNVDLKAIGTDQLVEKIGAQLGAVDDVALWAPKFDGIVIVRVVSCENHPNADKLHVCKVDDGGAIPNVPRDESNFVQVVCGAPNVREGMLVAWIPPGATVPTTFGTDEPFVLSAKELRGVVSNGMLASAAELGLSDNHDGLLEITADEVGGELTPGRPLASIYGLDDVVIDVENKMFTHRPDCFGVLGVAREIAGITGQAFVSPKWYSDTPTFVGASGLPLTVRVDIPQLVPRFMAVTYKDVSIHASPSWLQSALTRIGIRPINTIVDITNWVMYVTGQPLHAYDYDKLAARSTNGAELIARFAEKGETITLLNGKTIEPRAEAIMIASSNELIGVGGVMGGADTEVDLATKNIVLEAASFDMYSIRRTSMAHGLFTDAVSRFNKGQSALQNDRIIAYAMQQIELLAGGVQASDVIDVQAELAQNPVLSIDAAFVNERLGLHLVVTEMVTLLKNVEFIVQNNGDTIEIQAPFWRTDIVIAEDVVEEIGRLYGFDHLPLVLPTRTAEPTMRDPLLALKSELRHTLRRAGANELLTYSFVHGDLLKKVGQNPDDAFVLSNALSPSLQYYRLSVTPSLLEKVHPNLKAGYGEYALFEIGKTHTLKQPLNAEGVPAETEKLAFVYAANAKMAQKGLGAPYFKAKNFLMFIAQSLGLSLTFEPMTAAEAPFEPSRAAAVMLDGQAIGIIGEYTATAMKNLKLPNQSAGFEITITSLLSNSAIKTKYVPLPKFPKVSQDISLKVPKAVAFAQVSQMLQDTLAAEKPAHTYAELAPLDIYSSPDMPDVKHMAFRLTIASYEQTLLAESVNGLLDTLATAAQKKMRAERI